MSCHICFCVKYFLVSNALLHMGNFATGLKYTYQTEFPAICNGIKGGPQELYKGNMNFTYYNSQRIGTVQTTDGNKETCDAINGHNQQPYLRVQFDKPVRINYVSIVYKLGRPSEWQPYLIASNTFPCQYVCPAGNKPPWTSLYYCGGHSVQNFVLRWKSRRTVICEIQIFTDKTCGYLPQLENGKYIASNVGNVSDYWYEIGTNATIQCPEGFQPSDLSSFSTKIQCEKSGRWSFTNVTCKKITCGFLPQLDNGSYVVSSVGNITDYLYEIGTNATIQCSEGFQPSDLSSIPNKIQCEKSGQWSFTNITCQKITCGFLPQLENGSYVVSSVGNMSDYLFEISTNATLQCSEGFQPSDLSSIPNKIQCEKSGQWSFTNITCQKITCAVLPHLENGKYVVSSAGDESINYLHEIGTTATIQCSEGFQTSDFSSIPTTIQCEKSGQWSFTNVTCQKITCGFLPQLENGSYVVSSVGNMSDYLFEISTNATLQCSEGFQPSDLSSIPTTIQCEMIGQWSFTNVTCQRMPNQERMDQYLYYAIPAAIVILLILAITVIILCRKKISNNMERQRSEMTTSAYDDTLYYIEPDEHDETLYEIVRTSDNPWATCFSNTQPRPVLMLKSCDQSSSSTPQDCDKLYENIRCKT